MRFFTTALVSALAALASAYTQPDYSQNPTGNAILTPELNQVVPAGKPFEITWDPTTSGTVSLVLLRGPSTNVVPIQTIVEDIDNSGSYSWTPSTTLEPDTTHYGILLVVEGTGQYQYSVQFGISNPYYSSSSSVAAATSTTAAAAVSSDASETSVIISKITSTICPETATATADVKPTSVPVVGGNKPTSFVVAPSASGSASLIRSSATPSGTPAASSSSVSPVFTGAADRNAISLGAVAVGVAAVLAF
ncbi:hypothetical protein CBS63078_1237 [Aspergillus niger]|uniref:Differential expressed Balu-42 from patent US2003215950-A1-Aspergillus niger n=4 Tax=Aspergillus niger TaxID=5061 RepID=A2RAR3_ASPNC|nr:differential expressed Balu-42 from patent US2003215950-A1-Aspergillus niger [Aspergillus niger]XP_025449172.1 extracellular serine-threonine rich protein [Aspergillus niger CBS 101883]EHA19043.1 hypothetical protein ASPNIDRAFT_56792 [Aspergillus niger ATCC 1015]RDH24671.1 extracellular serine-threonine rich protein [Aspergillus niger ATCC 13496]KAI2819226.1 hypothetical protein CBS115989_4606 [Aspergillus niger]KAI2833920.1 hypothetical protein CBS133816_261 [Aspergillus niger]KAI2845951.|eukprot:XP_001398865.1 extracellular serine-threonine rich protein [Aspergillus niger CBS 513.88]